MRRRALLTAAGGAVLAPVVGTGTARASVSFPERIELPDGFRPEGIAIGPGPFAYLGSLADGSIRQVDLWTGRGRQLAPGPGTPSVGLASDHRGRLFVSGGAGGDGRVIDLRTGETLASHRFADGDAFVNDVVLACGAAFFTDSLRPFLYRLDRAGVAEVPLGGDIEYVEGFNLNGIERTPDGSALLAVQSNTATLFRIDPRTGVGRTVDLGGEPLTNGDGLLVRGRRLYVVQNRLNRVAIFALNRSGTAGRLLRTIGHPDFDVPTTVAAFGNRLYLPNARFETEPTPTTAYWVTMIDLGH